MIETLEVLKKKLKILKKVPYVKDWDLYFKIIGGLIRTKQLKFDSLIDHRKYHFGNPIEIDILKSEMWSTFQELHRMDLDSNFSLKITCETYGFRDDVESKWSGILQLPEHLLYHFEQWINSDFNNYVKEVDKKEEETKRQKRLLKITEKLLK